jgi:hypothetical protein
MSEPMLGIKIERLGEVLATVGYIPSALVGSLGEAIYDHMSHHRKSVIGAAGLSFSNPARGRRFVASRLFAYGRRRPNPRRLSDLAGESFAAALASAGKTKDGGRFPITKQQLELLERGGNQTTREAMAIPIGEGLNESGPYKGRFKPAAAKAIRERRTDLVVRPGRPTLIVQELAASRRGGVDLGVRSQVIGILSKKRAQAPVLGFFEQARRIESKHAAKYDRVIEQALTASGREALSERSKSLEIGAKAYRAEFAKLIGADPGNHAGARRAAEQAAREARRGALRGGRR